MRSEIVAACDACQERRVIAIAAYPDTTTALNLCTRCANDPAALAAFVAEFQRRQGAVLHDGALPGTGKLEGGGGGR